MSIVTFRKPAFTSIFDEFITRDLVSAFNDSASGFTLPAVNIQEDDNAFHLEVAAPGLTKEAFKLEMEQNVLHISSEKVEKNEEEDKSKRFTRKEFSYASFKRSFTLPKHADAEAITAKYENGVLHIVVPKKVEVKTHRLIDIL